MRALHLLVWDFFKGKTNPREKGEIIHHRNLDRKDARIKNLGKGTRREHGLAHKARRQKFSKKKKYDLGERGAAARRPRQGESRGAAGAAGSFERAPQVELRVAHA